MQSSHSQNGQQSSHNFLEIAKRLLGSDCPVTGQGRWCLKTPMAAYLFSSRTEAVASLLDPNDRYCRVFDLMPPAPAALCGNIKSQIDWDDRLQERRREREQKSK